MTTAVLNLTYPLTPLQEGMLFHSRLASGAGVYVQQIVVNLPESVDADALRLAWQFVAQTHPALRTAFPDEAEQTVVDDVEIPFEELNWAGAKETGAMPTPLRGHGALQAFLAADRRRGFDFAAPPLTRLTLIRRGPAAYELVWTFHHALLDGRSHRLILEEAFAAYEAIRTGAHPPVAPTRPFREHLEWLREQDTAAAEHYWRGLLAGFDTPTPLPAGAMSSISGEPDPGDQVVQIPEDVTAGLKAFAAENELTPTTLLHAAWAVLMARYSGESDVIFGGTRAGRRPDLERAGPTVGLLINTLPVRAKVNAETVVLDLLADLRAQWLAGRDFDFAAPVDVQTWAGLPGGTPLYETIVVAENYDLTDKLQALGGSWAKRSVELHEAPHYPLALTVNFGAEASLRLLYDRRRIDDEAAGRLLGHIRTLLEAIPAHAAAPVRDLPMLTPAERQQVLYDWNSTAGDYPRDRCLDQLVEAQVDRTPDAIAVIHEGQSWTYRELDERANRLAHHLRGLGAKPGSLVGVCMNRSAEMVAAVLGILKAGAGYVPLDPANPKERLAFLLRDTDAVALVTQVRRIGQLPEIAVPVVCIDADWPTISLHVSDRPERRGTADDVAYVIYTSGSTGTPKGVVLRHRAVVNTIDWVNAKFGVGPGDRVLWVTSLCFDLSVYDLFGVLAAGGTVRVATGSELRDPERLLRVLTTEPITIWDSAPSLLGQLAPHIPSLALQACSDKPEAQAKDRPPPLAFIISMEGADPILSPDDVGEWWAAGLRIVSLSHYGNSRYAHGTGTPGPLNELGPALLRAMEQVGMILDVTHLADEAMDQALDSFGGTVIASHHNCRALVDRQRQLRDSDIQKIVARGGVIGASCDAWMLDADCGQGPGKIRRVATLESVADHIDHVCQLAGSAKHSAIGSDLDGGFGTEQSPADLDTIADLQRLPAILARRGYSADDVRGIMHGNWFELMRRAWQ